MSIRYSLFRIPKNIDEFVDAVNKRGVKKVGITIVPAPAENWEHAVRPVIEADKIKLKLPRRWNYYLLGGIKKENEIKVLSTYNYALDDAILAAKNLAGRGLEVSIEDGLSIDEAIKKLYTNRKQLESMTAEYEKLCQDDEQKLEEYRRLKMLDELS